jgi:simple sugar transport system permease protein
LATAGLFVLIFLLASVRFDGFGSTRNFANLLVNNAHLGVIAVGMTFVILSGGIDLSVGTLLGFTTILLADLVEGGTAPGLAVLLCLGAGGLFGAAQGALVHHYRLPPFLVTLAGMFLAKGMAFVVRLQSLPIDHDGFKAAARWAVKLPGKGSLSAAALVFLAVVLAGALVAGLTRFGRNVYAVGGSESSALLMGLPVGWTKVWVYALSGFCAALGGVVYAMGTESGNPAIGLGMELDAIACTVIGGTLLTGGSGSVPGTFFGVLIYGTLNEALRFQGTLDSSWLRIAMGALLLTFIVAQRLLTRRAEGSAK